MLKNVPLRRQLAITKGPSERFLKTALFSERKVRYESTAGAFEATVESVKKTHSPMTWIVSGTAINPRDKGPLRERKPYQVSYTPKDRDGVMIFLR